MGRAPFLFSPLGMLNVRSSLGWFPLRDSCISTSKLHGKLQEITRGDGIYTFTVYMLDGYKNVVLPFPVGH